jgi:hypothetical protein
MSTATPEKLPEIGTVRRLTKSIAMLDAIICPEWEFRYYSFKSKWAEGQEMASMRNGCGDEWFILFDSNGAAIKGFAHECALARDRSFAARIQQVVPPMFGSFLHEPAFSMNLATFCFWRRHSDPTWSVVPPASGVVSPEADGSAELIAILGGGPECYREWAADYYEQEIPLSAVQAIYAHEPLNGQLVATLNPECSLAAIANDAKEIGYGK